MIALPAMAPSTEPTEPAQHIDPAEPTTTTSSSTTASEAAPLRQTTQTPPPLAAPTQDMPQPDAAVAAFGSPQSQQHRNYTPSISPLSTTSRTHHEYFADTNHLRQSPIPPQNHLDAVLPAGDAAMPDAEMHHGRDDRSSSLSDFEGNFEDQENNSVDTRRSPQPVEEADSEAETERLERTPQKAWRSTETGRTPSKLNQHTSLDDDLSDPASSPNSPLRDAQSPSPTHRFSASPSAIAGQKRKRSTPVSEPDSPLSDAASDSEEIAPPAQTNGTAKAAQDSPKASPDETAEDGLEDAPREGLAAPGSVQQTPEPEADEVDENPYISPMKAARLKGKKQRAKRQKETPVIQAQDYDVDYDEAMEEMHDDEDSAAKSEEGRENKKQAQAAFTALTEKFNLFRAKLQAEKLAAAEAELQQLTSAQPDHPEYLAQVQAITLRRDTKIRQEYALQFYKTQALLNQTLAERAQLHSQFYQESREARDSHLERLGKKWYDIQKERRSQLQPDQADRYTYKYPTKFSDQIRNQRNYNQEVSILSGIQKYRGFPAAPEIHGSRPAELDDDLRAMKIQIRPQPAHVQQAQQPPPVYQNHGEHSSGVAARLAQEKWVEQNPWANAQHPSHQQSRTPAPFPTFHNPPPGNAPLGHFHPPSAHTHRTNSPFTTPLPPQKRADYHTNGLGSGDTIGVPSDPPSSALNASATLDKGHRHGAGDDGSPIDSLKVRAAISNPLLNREDRRNFSNISSASTIDAPNDADVDRHHQNPYASLSHGPMPPTMPTDTSASRQAFLTNALHAQHGKPEDRRHEIYDSVNFRHTPGVFGTPLPLFANGSPVRQEKQRAT